MSSLISAWHELDVSRHKAEFYRMWHLTHKSGLQQEVALSQMGDFRRSPTVARLRNALLVGARQRTSLRDIISKNTGLFEDFEKALLVLGEDGGKLEEVSSFLANYFQAEHRAVQRMKRRLAYPMINTVAAIFIVSFPVLFFGDVLKYFVVVTAELAVAAALGGTVLARVASSHRNRLEFVVGRFCRSLSMGIEAGLSLDKVMELAVAAAAAPELSKFFARIPRDVRSGKSPAEIFSGAPVIPEEIVRALKVAEVTGNYGDTMVKLADLYDGGIAAA